MMTNIIVDGCLYSNSPNTLDFVKKVNKTFSGKLIGISSVYVRQLLDAGCIRGCRKSELEEIRKILFDES
ncbi:hypothetical protein A2V71_00515 [Candidatus Berkelbacteria bacterium RBG_13_40_8]|uniref:PIN domain-containing protein n=1 Tax=Candidatus Berkelbacteria bacterium RBG_13_40_8 TaxID=1797467 RepID=A0A1F5DQH3_9BACT|nr:MAG: hypothetical protein A2V71_00515 [Candidatus Berkelbacteria bacterium RBG_13_40_8]